MTRALQILLISLVVALMPSRLSASVPLDKLYFNYITQETGLPGSGVRAVSFDADGYLWIGTVHGLCRYDGQQVRTWYKEDLGLESDYITAMRWDRGGRLWITTVKGASIYDPAMCRFTPLVTLCGETLEGDIWHISDDPSGEVWLAANGEGILAVNPDTWEMRRLFYDGTKQTLPANVSTLYKDSTRGIFLLALYGRGLYETDADGSFLRQWQDDAGGEPLRSRTPLSILRKEGNTLLALCPGGVLCELNCTLHTSSDVPVTFPDNVKLRYGYKVDETVAMLLSNKGAFFYDWSDGRLQRLTRESHRASIAGNALLCADGNLRDGLAIGASHDGASVQYRLPLEVETLSGPLAAQNICGFAQTRDGRIWVGTRSKGIYVSEGSSFVQVTTDSGIIPSGISRLQGCGDILWIDNESGIYSLDTRTMEQHAYTTKRSDSGPVYCCADGTVLAGMVSGLFRLDRSQGMLVRTPYLSGKKICSILEDSRGRLWLGTFKDGLYCYEGDRQTHYTFDPHDPLSLPSQRINAITEDSEGNIWVVPTGGGIARWDGCGFKRFTVREGLSSDLCLNVIPAPEGSVWVTTEYGLNRIDPDGEVRRYFMRDGLLNNRFNTSAYLMAQDGHLLLGSGNGAVRISPDTDSTPGPPPHVCVSSLWIGGEEVLPGDESGILSRAISQTSKVVLPWSRRSFALTMSVIDRASLGAGALFFKLDGYLSEWTQLQDSRTVNFRGMPSGHYTLHLKGVSGSGVWNEDFPGLEIVVRPPFWRSPVAIILYILLIAGAVWAAVLQIRRREERRRTELETRLKMEMNEGRLDLFRGIVHEIKTPLSLIKAPLEEIMASGHHDEHEMEALTLMERNASYLTDLSDELLYYTKVERDGFELHTHLLNLMDQLSLSVLNFRQSFSERGMRLSLDGPESLMVRADSSALAKIFNNLLSNALKYASGYLDIKAQLLDGSAVVQFCNDGEVVPAHMRRKVFDSFVRGGREASGFGIGLSVARTLAGMHGGSIEMDDDMSCNRFILTLPAEAMQATEQDSPLPEIPSAKDKKARILVVEDNSELREYLCSRLKRRYEVLQAPDGERAMARIREVEGIDLMLTDLSMPGMDGLELCNAIKGDFTFSHIIVVILSAHLTGQAMIDSMDSRADLLVEKPFSMDYIYSCIESLLHNRELRVTQARQENPAAREPDTAEGSVGSGLSVRDEMFIRDLHRIVDEHLSDPELSIESLASGMHISKTTLKRKVRDLLDTTPNDFIREKRLTVAERMLVTSTDRISEICFATGFQTPSYFAKCFKARYGLSPQDYLKSKKAA